MQSNESNPLYELAIIYPCHSLPKNISDEDFENFANQTKHYAAVGYYNITSANNSDGLEWPFEDNYLEDIIGEASTTGIYFLFRILANEEDNKRRFDFIDENGDGKVDMNGMKV